MMSEDKKYQVVMRAMFGVSYVVHKDLTKDEALKMYEYTVRTTNPYVSKQNKEYWDGLLLQTVDIEEM